MAGFIGAPASHAGTTATFTFADMEQLHAGEGLFELWLVSNGAPVSIGRFNINMESTGLIDPNGLPLTEFTIPATLTNVTYAYITVEPDGDSDTVPGHRYLAGPVSAGAAHVTYTDPQGIGVDLSAAAGSFVITTPTTATGTDWRSGVWFFNPGTPRTPSLTLPALPGGSFGWQYEGWLSDVHNVDPVPYSTGEFASPNSSDHDGAGCGSGPLTAPSFPGADYIVACGIFPVMPLINDGGWSVSISCEPAPNSGPNPFAFLPLQIGVVPANTPENASVALKDFTNTLPVGTVVISTDTAVEPATWGGIKAIYR
jgi:hypothetical protein